MFNCVSISGDASYPGFGAQTEKTNMNGFNDARLPAYLHGEAKYHVLPVPTPLEPADALSFVTRELPLAHNVEEVVKLSHLAVFYNLRETADGFLSAGKLAGKEPLDAVRNAAAIRAVAWVGNSNQFAQAQAQFAALIRRADLEQHQSVLLDTSYPLGPQAGTENLKQAVAATVESIRARQTELRPRGQPTELSMLENRMARLNEFVGLEITNLEKANKLRASIEALPGDEARVFQLVELYLDDTPDSTPHLADWAGLKLLRSSARAKIAAEFLAQAKRYDKKDPERQPELDAVRVRALRSAQFFGAPPSVLEKKWLAKQKDTGTDLLALRPEWNYPAAHAHSVDKGE